MITPLSLGLAQEMQAGHENWVGFTDVENFKREFKMPSQTIEEAIARLDWAKAHVDSFLSEVQTYFSTSYELVGETAPMPGESKTALQISLKAKQPLPMSLRFKAGDAINNLRSILDCLIWELGTRVGESDKVSLAFRKTPKDFSDFAKKDKFDLFPPDIQDWLESIQIYKQPNNTPTQLEQLNVLWNESKHRVPNLIVAANTGSGIDFAQGKGEVDLFMNISKPPVKHGDVIGQAIVRNDQLDNFRPVFIFDLLFEKVMVNASVFLTQVEQHIRNDVLPRFEPHLK